MSQRILLKFTQNVFPPKFSLFAISKIQAFIPFESVSVGQITPNTMFGSSTGLILVNCQDISSYSVNGSIYFIAGFRKAFHATLPPSMTRIKTIL
jgi:hypothetical protein